MREGESLALGDSELALFDCITREHVNIVGTEMDYYQVDQARSIKDPLYGEPSTRLFNGPFRIKGFFGYPDHTPSLGMEGYSSYFDATAFIPRVELERVGLVGGMTESDIIRVWMSSPYWQQNVSVDGFNVPGAGLYFSVVDTREDGVLFDNPSFVGFAINLRRTTQQAAERKIQNSL